MLDWRNYWDALKQVRNAREAVNVKPAYRRVDTCAAEFPANSAYMYSTYEEECEAHPTDRQKIMVLGGGPNRIGQGIEFDYMLRACSNCDARRRL